MNVIDQLVAVMKEMNDNHEFFDEMGRMIWNIYQGFIRAGFTEEQALEIVKRMETPVSSK